MQPQTSLEIAMDSFRAQMKVHGEYLLQLKNGLILQPKPVEGSVEDRGEEIANLTLAYRHLEDCIMRCGKVIQAYQGGKSIYYKPAMTTMGGSPQTPGSDLVGAAEPSAQ
jgi:hypothetical protein